jgi:hypothetical protein
MTLPAGSDDIIPPSLAATAKKLREYLSAEQLATPTPIDDFPLFQVKEKNHHGRLNGMIYAIRDSVATVLSGVAAALLAINTAVGQAQGYATAAYNSAAAATSAAGTAAANAVTAVGTALHDLVTQAGGYASDANQSRIDAQAAADAAIGVGINDAGSGIGIVGQARSADWHTKDHMPAVLTTSQAVVPGNEYPMDTTAGALNLALPAGVDGNKFWTEEVGGKAKSNPISLIPNGTNKVCGISDTVTITFSHVRLCFIFKASINGWVLG